MCVYEDRLIVSCININGAVICESENPTNQESFKIIATDEELFHYPAYNYCDSIYGGSIFDMTQYGKSLYVSICTGKPENAIDENTMQSFALVRGDVDGKLYVGTYDASSFLIPLDEYMNDENAAQEWKNKVDEYVEKLCSNYQGIPDSAVTCGEYLRRYLQ